MLDMSFLNWPAAREFTTAPARLQSQTRQDSVWFM
jgi:hypothetical protein